MREQGVLFHGGVGFAGEGIQRRKRFPQGRTGGRAGRQTDRQTVPRSSCCLHPPLTTPRKSCSWFVSNPFTLCQVRVVSLGGAGGGQWAEPQTSTDGSRYKAPDIRQQQMQGAVNAEGRTHSDQPCRYQDSTEETALPRGAGWEAPQQQHRASPGPTLLTGANVFCKLFCVSTGFSFCMQANSIHWKTTTSICLHGYLSPFVPGSFF